MSTTLFINDVMGGEGGGGRSKENLGKQGGGGGQNCQKKDNVI